MGNEMEMLDDVHVQDHINTIKDSQEQM